MTALTTGPAGGVLTSAGPVQTPSDWARDRAAQLRALADVPPDAQIPLYGSEEWAALEDNDAVRWLSALRAAEAWRQDSDPHALAARVDAELQAEWRAVERDYDGWRTVAAQARDLARTPDHRLLEERRRQLHSRGVVNTDGWPPVTQPGTWDQWTRTVA